MTGMNVPFLHAVGLWLSAMTTGAALLILVLGLVSRRIGDECASGCVVIGAGLLVAGVVAAAIIAV